MFLGEESKLCDSTSKMELANFVSEVKNQVLSFLNCKLCKDIHSVNKCLVFKGMDLKSKQDFVADHHLCVKCLRQSHVDRCRDALCNNECPKCPSATFHNSVLCPENMANKSKQLPAKATKTSNWTTEEGDGVEIRHLIFCQAMKIIEKKYYTINLYIESNNYKSCVQNSKNNNKA